jgi:hypothetical protein
VPIHGLSWLSAAVLLAVALLGSLVTPYEMVVRFIVTLAATVAMFQALYARRYALAAVFGLLALLYNPVAPAFSLSGAWQSTVVFATALLFVASVVWRDSSVASRS